jgi:hypothetical protein
MADNMQKWLSRAGRPVMPARLRCRLGRHNGSGSGNPESGDTYDRCHYCRQLKHVETIGNGIDQLRGVTSFSQGGGGL